MKHNVWIVALAALAASPPAFAKKSEHGSVFPYKTEKTVLDNGLTVVSVPLDAPGDHRLLHDRSYRLAQRGRERIVRFRALL